MADLTRDAILALPAGPALDALVAERVLGHRWPADRCRVCGFTLAASRAQGCVPDNCSQRPVPPRRADDPPRYSTDIAAAWPVVEHMRAAGWHPLIGYCDGDHDRPMPEVQFVHDSGAPAGFVNCDTNRCDTMPHAICVAALMAKLGLDDQEERTDG